MRAAGRRRAAARADGPRRDPRGRAAAAADRGRPRVPRPRRGAADGDRRLHAVPGVVRVAPRAAPRRQRARRRARRSSAWTSARTRRCPAGRSTTRPFGGGAGMVLRVDVLDAALRARYGVDPVRAARAAPRDRARARRAPARRRARRASWPREPALTLLCGRYEGFDERIVEHFASDVVSIGRYVLSGGEPAAMVLCDAVVRKLPGALGDERSARGGVLQRGARGQPRVPALHAPGRVPRLGACPRCCSPATTSGSTAGGASAAASAARARPPARRAAPERRLGLSPRACAVSHGAVRYH